MAWQEISQGRKGPGMSGKISARHHTVPRTYLKGFADSDGLVDAWHRGQAPRDRLHIGDVTVRKDFYNAVDENGRRHDEVEKWFASNVEAPVGPVLARLRADGPQPVDGSDAHVVTEFVAAQALRTVAVRAYMKQVDEDLAPKFLLERLLREYGNYLLAIEPQRMSALIRNMLHAGVDPVDVQRSHLRTTVREIPKLADRISHYRWHTADAERPWLITGDAPVVVLQASLTAFGGIVPKGSPIYVPLTPTRLLVGDPSTTGRPDKVTERLVKVVNTRIAYGATDVILKARSQAWPASLPFSKTAPRLPPPGVSPVRSGCGLAKGVELGSVHESVRALLNSLGTP